MDRDGRGKKKAVGRQLFVLYSISLLFYMSLCLFYQRPQPVQKPKRPAREDPVQDDRAGDGEDLAADPKDLPFLFIFDRRSSDRVGKTGDGNECPGTAPFCDTWIETGPGEDDTQEDKDK